MSRPALRSLVACVLLVLVASTVSQAAEPEEASPTPQIDAKALAAMVQSFDKVEKIEYPWGWIRWIMNSQLDPNAEMTFGIVQVDPGQTNPLHIHANCEEQLYVLSGSCEHRIGDKMVVLKAGDVIRIPRNVPHMAKTTEKEGMRAVIVYSAGQRQFEVVEE